MNRFICDGHEYRVIDNCTAFYDSFAVLNNYGSSVATYGRDEAQEHWHLVLSDGEEIASIHENDIEGNLLNEWAVQQYVAWAMDNDTVEEHA